MHGVCFDVITKSMFPSFMVYHMLYTSQYMRVSIDVTITVKVHFALSLVLIKIELRSLIKLQSNPLDR